jgi:hypothetical protein
MKSHNNVVYCFDSSAFITLHRFYSHDFIPDLWNQLEVLIYNGNLISHEIVLNEIDHDIKKQDRLTKWVLKHSIVFRPISQRQMNLLPEILQQFPKLIDYHSEKEQADSYLIAMLIELNEENDAFINEYVLVSTENKRSPEKIPAACTHFRIRHMDLHEFFIANSFKFSMSVR